MKLTKEIKARIGDAWDYQAATSCSWAMNELNKFALLALCNGIVQVENYNAVINNLKTFLIWKNQDLSMTEIPILGNKSQKEVIRIVNSLVEDFAVTHMALEEIDVNNQYFTFKLSGQDAYFKLDIERPKTSLKLMRENIAIGGLKFEYISEQHYRFSCQILEPNSLNFFSKFEESSLDFNRIGIR